MPTSKNALIVEKCTAIPPFPAVALKLLRVLDRKHTSLTEIVDLARKDVAITAAVLRVANSGMFGRGRTTAGLGDAVRILGTTTFSTLVMRTSVAGHLSALMPKDLMDSCWKHSIVCAEFSRMLAAAVGCSEETANAAGLLHDIGRFGMASGMPAEYKRLAATTGYIDPLDAEDAVFGTNHTAIGRRLAEKLGLPEEFQVVAGRHHDGLDESAPAVLQAVSAGCRIASAIGFTVSPSRVAPSLQAVIAQSPAPLRGRINEDAEYWKARAEELTASL